MELIDEADLGAAHARPFGVAEVAAIDAVDDHGAAVRLLEEPGDVQQGGFARARRPEQRHRLAGIERRGRAFQHLDQALALRVGALQLLEAERRRLIGSLHGPPLLVAQGFDRIEARGPPGRIERGEDGEHERHDHDRDGFAGIHLRRQLRQVIELR